MKQIVPASIPTEVIAVQRRGSTGAAADWQPWDGTLMPGHYHTDLVKARLQLHAQHIVPRVCLTAGGAVRQLSYNDVVLHRRLPETDVCQEFARNYNEVFGSGIVYRGESMASLCAQVFSDLCRPTERPVRNKHCVAFFLAEQQGVCASCGVDLRNEDYHVDHKIARANYGSDGADNLQLLCASGCHASKTAFGHSVHGGG